MPTGSAEAARSIISCVIDTGAESVSTSMSGQARVGRVNGDEYDDLVVQAGNYTRVFAGGTNGSFALVALPAPAPQWSGALDDFALLRSTASGRHDLWLLTPANQLTRYPNDGGSYFR